MPVDEITAAYRRKVKWQNAINGVSDKPEQTPQDVNAQLRGFAAWHNARLKQQGGTGIGKKGQAR